MPTEKLELSFSAMETFKTCQRKYYYNYILRLPKEFWPWLIFGNFVHLVFEKFYKYVLYFKKRNILYDKKELMKRAYVSAVKKQHRLFLSNDKTQHVPALTTEQKTDCQIIIKQYLEKIKDEIPQVLFVEKPFRIEVDDLLIIKGYIDRIDRINENMYHVVDYKTSKSTSPIDKTKQLDVYSMALKNILKKDGIVPKEIKQTLDFLKLNEETTGFYNNDNDEKVIQYIKDVAKDINALKEKGIDSEWKATENNFCFCCDFRKQCAIDVRNNKEIMTPTLKSKKPKSKYAKKNKII